MDTKDPYIKLDSFLKHHGVVESGGHAKKVIQGGAVTVNGEVETRRGKKLRQGDRVDFEDTQFIVTATDLD